jgi:hypothetical protein
MPNEDEDHPPSETSYARVSPSAIERSEHMRRVAEHQARVERQRARAAAAEARAAGVRSRLEKETEDLELARQGLKRSFWTGRIVPVKSSRRARAHLRRVSKARGY